MTQDEMFEASFNRPHDYFRLTEDHQWTIDQRLGILDWRGDNLTNAQLERYRAHYKKGIK